MAATASTSLVGVEETAHQPISFPFPKRPYGIKNIVYRSFQPKWFNLHPWIHYIESNDSVLCYVCMQAIKQKKMSEKRADNAFITRGYHNWKDAVVAFKKHEESVCHKEATDVMLIIPSQHRDCGEMLSGGLAREKAINRQMLYRIISSIRYLARQGLALRGDGNEDDGNFNQLLLLRAIDDPSMLDWLQKKRNKYTSPEIQNELMMVMSHEILRMLANDIQQSLFYTIMVDEATDKSNKEQVVLVLRWVDKKLLVSEDFIGLYNVPKIDSETLTMAIKDCLLRLNLSLSKARGQCYDGASNMSGAKSGVAKRIQDEEKRAVYTHCYGHALNLACSDAIKGCKLTKEALESAYELIKLIKFSPKREEIFNVIKEELAPGTAGIKVLCRTRWTVRGESLSRIISNYSFLQTTFEECKDLTNDTEMKSRIIGTISQMQSFDFFFGTMLAELILKHSDNLSRTLQHAHLSAAEGQEVAKLTVETLQSLRCENNFDLFWQKVDVYMNDLNVNEPTLPRRRKAPQRYEICHSEPFFSATPKEFYRRFYYEALDLVINSISRRFDQPGYKTYKNVEELLLKAAQGKDYHAEFDFVINFYGSDFVSSQLDTQLQTLGTYFANNCSAQKNIQLKDILSYLQSLSEPQLTVYSQVVTLATLMLVMPATNAASERSFSALTRIKTYLRATMSQTRLNSLMVLHVHKEMTDKLNLYQIANTFISNKPEHRFNIFGKFTHC